VLFRSLLTLPDIGELLYRDASRIRQLMQASIAFLRSVAAYTDAGQVR
jgi:hypothetical protein